MSARLLKSVFESWSRGGQPLVLASVYATDGSTYSKSGAQMLISGDGNFQGMLSGGCLEGDLAERARSVAKSGNPQAITYDLGLNDEELWGLGIGCDGQMSILLQALSKQHDYEPFRSMLAAYEGTDIQASATVVASDVAALAAGSSLVLHRESILWTDIDLRFQSRVVDAIGLALADNRSQCASLEIDEHSCEVLLSVLHPRRQVLVLGAGLDAEPVVRFIAELGWRCVISDHRPAYIENGKFADSDRVCCIDANDISSALPLHEFDAVVVMSHHLKTDEVYLRQIAASPIPYVGLLGPANRRDYLLTALGDEGATLTDRLHGPAGLELNASGPASIALSIVAQIQRQLSTQD